MSSRPSGFPVKLACGECHQTVLTLDVRFDTHSGKWGLMVVDSFGNVECKVAIPNYPIEEVQDLFVEHTGTESHLLQKS